MYQLSISIIQDDDVVRRRTIDRRRSTTAPSEARVGVWRGVVIIVTMMQVVGGMTLAMTGDGRGHLMAVTIEDNNNEIDLGA